MAGCGLWEWRRESRRRADGAEGIIPRRPSSFIPRLSFSGYFSRPRHTQSPRPAPHLPPAPRPISCLQPPEPPRSGSMPACQQVTGRLPAHPLPPLRSNRTLPPSLLPSPALPPPPHRLPQRPLPSAPVAHLSHVAALSLSPSAQRPRGALPPGAPSSRYMCTSFPAVSMHAVMSCGSHQV